MRSGLWLALGAAIVLAAGASQASAAPRPNVLIIITDDQGYGDLSRHGNPYVKTPALDGLATKSVVFERFFVSPLCAPTRASLLTGRYSLRTGTRGVSAGEETIRPQEVTLAEIFSQAGYRTALFGKWHNGEHYPCTPQGQGFERAFGYNLGHWNNYFDTVLLDQGKPAPTRGYITDVITDNAIEYLEQPSDKPFLAYVSLATPHSPFQVPDAYFDRHKAAGLSDYLSCVYGMCENIDANVARLLKTLDDRGVRDDTIVIFVTDNGPNGQRYNADMKGTKGSLDEGGSRVPFFISWPKRFARPHTVKQIAAHIDVLPTLVELCGLKPEKLPPLDGRSLVPLLETQADDWPDRTIVQQHQYFEEPAQARAALRSQRYRAIKQAKGWQLYDMELDPGQTTDIARKQPEVVDRFQRQYDTWWNSVMPEANAPRAALEIGHPEENPVELSVPLANFSGLRYAGDHANNNWLTGWTSTKAKVTWNIEVATAGEYDVALKYLCPKEHAGATVRVTAGEAVAETQVTATAIEKVPSPDRVPRKEVYEMRWHALPVGRLSLERGPVALTIEATNIPAGAALDLKAVVLSRID